MEYVIPNEITLLDTNVSIEDIPEWIEGTYNTYDKVKVTSQNKKYKFAGVDGTTSNKYPNLDTTLWSKGLPLNPYAMFEYDTGAYTSNPESITASFNAINIDTIHLEKLEAKEVYVKIEDSSGAVLYEKTTSLVYDDLQDFGDYLFSEQELTDKMTGNVSKESLDLIIDAMSEEELLERMTLNPPIYYDTTVYIEIRNPGGTAKCTSCIIGRKRSLGLALYDCVIENKSTTKRERDADWGTVDLVKGVPYKIVDVPVFLEENTYVDIVQRRLEKIDGIVCLFLIDSNENTEYNSINIVGFYNDFEMPVVPGGKIYNLRLETK